MHQDYMIFMYKNVLLAFWFFSHISSNNTPLTAEVFSFLLPAIFITAEKIGFFFFVWWSFFYLLNLAIFLAMTFSRLESNVLK